MESLKRGRRLAWLVIVFFLAWGAGFQPAIGSAQELRREGQIQSVSGAVTAQSVGQDKPRPVSQGDLVYAQDRVVSGPNGKAQIKLDDGSLITLQPSSRIQILDSRANARHSSSLLLLKGWLQALVAPEEGANLEVQTATVVAGVRATSFTVAGAADCSSRVAVEKGKVEVQGHSQGLTLVPNQQMTVELTDKPLAAQAYDPQTANWAGFLSERSRRLAKNADHMAQEMDRELERRHQRAVQAQQTLAKEFQGVERAAQEAEATKDQPEVYEGKLSALKQSLELNYSQARDLQHQDGYLISCDEMLKQLIQDVKEHPENYSAAARKRVAALEAQVYARDVAGTHQATQATLDSYTSKLDALVAKYELGRELQQREYFEKRQQQEEEWLKKWREFQEQHRPR